MSEQSDHTQPNPMTSRGFLLSAVIIGVLVLLLVFLLVTRNRGDDTNLNPAGNAASPTATQGTTQPDTGQPSVCGLKDVQLTGSVNTAPQAEWQLVGTIAAPKAPDTGPGVIEDDGFRYCFAHTPKGALFAAANLLAMSGDNTLAYKVADKLTVPGTGRDKAMETAKTLQPRKDDGTRVQIAGFRFITFAGETATIDIVFQGNNGVYGSFVSDLLWISGDWKIRVSPDGRDLNPPRQIPNLSGYTLWSGA